MGVPCVLRKGGEVDGREGKSGKTAERRCRASKNTSLRSHSSARFAECEANRLAVYDGGRVYTFRTPTPSSIAFQATCFLCTPSSPFLRSLPIHPHSWVSERTTFSQLSVGCTWDVHSLRRRNEAAADTWETRRCHNATQFLSGATSDGTCSSGTEQFFVSFT